MHISARTAHNSLEKRETHKSYLKINKLYEWQKWNFSLLLWSSLKGETKEKRLNTREKHNKTRIGIFGIGRILCQSLKMPDRNHLR